MQPHGFDVQRILQEARLSQTGALDGLLESSRSESRLLPPPGIAHQIVGRRWHIPAVHPTAGLRAAMRRA